MKKHTYMIEVKDPDFVYDLGLSHKAMERIFSKSSHSENFAFEIEFDHEGNVVGARQLNIHR